MIRSGWFSIVDDSKIKKIESQKFDSNHSKFEFQTIAIDLLKVRSMVKTHFHQVAMSYFTVDKVRWPSSFNNHGLTMLVGKK